MAKHLEYFNQLYEQNDDPWSYADRWYEHRKRAICLSLLLHDQYKKGLELGCSNGIFSQQLAERCQHLVCIDANERAVYLAQQRLSSAAHVKILQKQLPDNFPEDHYDLIVISEIGYYLTRNELLKLIDLCQRNLTDNGMILLCHWRYPIEGFELNGETVHSLFKQEMKLGHYLRLNDKDFLIDVWTKHNNSLADQEGLV
ncbi:MULTISPECIES: class I SAM-dependent methyltransferase [unclassified Acinetobacter]|uniref:class I SAM-dependent methyltransferase n=1 Tax=unclassified Acinetobacter TaxID=196816 RepID=UPI00190E252E|nr:MULTISPECIES: class I SAM-dependent methyltransferase [unclassified Acinetobacter]MBK0064108.1 class I SAM-dependent methyltransferase [Acinetobacter sp. S55]MBK0067383.1 class I SAM-dependent methyltransferase [Acinetobacter sp. S54]